MANPSPKKRWNAEYAASMLDDAEQSGLSDREFAKRNGIDPQRLVWWRKRLNQPKPSKPSFIELEVSPSKAIWDLNRVEIRLANGRIVTTQVDVNPLWLPQLLDAVEGKEC